MSGVHVARRLPTFAGRAAWNAILGERPASRPLGEHATADAVVIGAGFAGLSAARRLIQLDPALRVIVLDATRVGEGASGRNTGFMIDLPHELSSGSYAGDDEGADRRLIALNRSAIRFARDAVLEYGMPASCFDPAGKVNGAGSEGGHAQNLLYAAHLDELPEPYEWLDAQSMLELTGSRYYLSGLYTPGTAMLQPAGYVRGMADGLSATVSLFEDSPVTGLRREGGHWRVTTPSGSVSTARILMANNGQLESFGFKRGRLMHVFLFGSMTEELDAATLRALGGRSRWGITPSDPMGMTVRRIDGAQGGNRIVARAIAQFCPEMATSERAMRRATRVIRHKFDARFPHLSEVRMQYTWSGHLCLSRQGVSVTGELDDGVFAACCQNGLGTTRGTLTGICAAEQALGETSAVTAYFAGQKEPEPLPPTPIATLGAAAVLRWKEWRARQE